MAERIPVTPMVKLYRELKGMSQRERLRRADRLLSRPDRLAAHFARSAEEFTRAFDHRDERFYDTDRRPLPSPPRRLDSTIAVAAHLTGSAPRRVLGDDRLDFTYVDRELVPARTKSGAMFADGRNIRTALRLDLLLANRRDRLPIVGEVKVAMDMDPFFALVQGLTLAAHLVSPSQRERMKRVYPRQGLRDSGKLDVYLLLAEAPAAGTYWFDLREAAAHMSEALMGQRDVAQSVRRIAAVDLDLLGDRLRISKRFAHPDRWVLPARGN
jgi:hypothetical protein